MTLTNTLRSLPQYTLQELNFSSATQPSLVLKALNHHCEYLESSSELLLRPKHPSKWLVIFCDEINLPATDAYGTQVFEPLNSTLIDLGGTHIHLATY